MLTTPSAISLQLYSLRSELDTGLTATINRVAELGITTVELYNLVALAPELSTALPAAGITAPTAHARTIGEDQDLIFSTAASLGVTTLIDPHIPAERWTNRDDISRIADDLNATAETAARHGLGFGYHNHYWELQRLADGATALEALAPLLSPAVTLEVDAYWAAVGGADVPALLTALGDRVRFLHLKDAPLTADGTLSHDRHAQLPVGQGAINWDAIIAASPSVELHVIEFDEFSGDIYQGISDSLSAIRALTS